MFDCYQMPGLLWPTMLLLSNFFCEMNNIWCPEFRMFILNVSDVQHLWNAAESVFSLCALTVRSSEQRVCLSKVLNNLIPHNDTLNMEARLQTVCCSDPCHNKRQDKRSKEMGLTGKAQNRNKKAIQARHVSETYLLRLHKCTKEWFFCTWLHLWGSLQPESLHWSRLCQKPLQPSPI